MDDRATRTAALMVATSGAFLTPFMGSAINIALPTIGGEFAADAIVLGWISTAYLLSAAVFLVPFGRVADIYGRKRIFAYGVVIYAIASLLCAVAPSVGWLIAFRIAQGLGGALIFGTGVAILTSAFPPQERGRVLGINVASTYLGLSLGPFLGGFLTQQLGWRSIFFINALLGALTAAVTVGKLKEEWVGAQGDRLDWLGSLVYGTMLAAVMYGFSLLPQASGAGLIFLGLLGGVALVRWEGRTDSPIVDIRLFANNLTFTLSNLAALINYSATFAVGFLLSLYLQHVRGLEPQVAGIILVSQPAMQAGFSPLAGWLSDRAEPRVVASAGMMVTVVGLALLSLLDTQTHTGFIIATLALLGLGFAFFSSPNTNAVMSAVDRRSYGVAAATLATMRLVGQMLSMGIAMLTFALVMGRVPIAPENYPLFLNSTRTAFLIFTFLCIGGVFASLGRGRLR